ncbi:MAG TPA: hypothetical protein VK813_13575 [Edaphobacter sp.]|jgi:hypothetical protein|nr:hypothetical protein [Edaphobacter sp.]
MSYHDVVTQRFVVAPEAFNVMIGSASEMSPQGNLEIDTVRAR